MKVEVFIFSIPLNNRNKPTPPTLTTIKLFFILFLRFRNIEIQTSLFGISTNPFFLLYEDMESGGIVSVTNNPSVIDFTFLVSSNQCSASSLSVDLENIIFLLFYLSGLDTPAW